MRASTQILTILATLTACTGQPTTIAETIDLCELGVARENLSNKRVVLTAWYTGTLETAALNSSKCPETIVDPQFSAGTTATFANPNDPNNDTIKAGSQIGVAPDGQFHGRFYGVLRKRTFAQGSELTFRQMPYRLVIDRIDDVRPGRPAFLRPPPTP